MRVPEYTRPKQRLVIFKKGQTGHTGVFSCNAIIHVVIPSGKRRSSSTYHKHASFAATWAVRMDLLQCR